MEALFDRGDCKVVPPALRMVSWFATLIVTSSILMYHKPIGVYMELETNSANFWRTLYPTRRAPPCIQQGSFLSPAVASVELPGLSWQLLDPSRNSSCRTTPTEI